MYFINIVLTLFIFIDITWSSCVLEVSSEFGAYAPLLIRETDKRIIYPTKQYPKIVQIQPNDKLVANCPQNSITISGTSIDKPYTTLTCVIGSSFKLPNGEIHQFKNIRCSDKSRLTIRQTGRRCSSGNIIEIGFEHVSSTFITIMDFCYHKDTAVTYWAHTMITSAIFNNEAKIKKHTNYRYKSSEIDDGIDIINAYMRPEERKSLLGIMNGNQALVDKYIHEMGTTFFARGLLITRSDMFYLVEQFSIFHYINVVPIWQSINDGNWKEIEKETRKLAKNIGDVEVYSGGLYTLELPFTSTDSREIFLSKNKKTGAPAVFVPRLLFKLVYHSQQNRAIVFVIINNPHLSAGKIPGNYLICREYKECSLKNVPDAQNIKKGFSYCCLYDDFMKDTFVQKIGLPKLQNVQPLSI